MHKRTKSILFEDPLLAFVLYALPLSGLSALNDGLAEERTHFLDPATGTRPDKKNARSGGAKL